jgi:transcription elongation factor GreA
VSKIRFTKQGYENLKLEYQKLKDERPAAVVDLSKARAMGDLKENGYYQAARRKLSSIDFNLRRISLELKQAVIVDEASNGSVDIGSTVTLENQDGKITYHIVGDLEANPSEKKISLNSPLGKALAGKKSGENITIEIPKGIFVYKITNIV